MKCAVVATLISLVFVSQASAVLRPLFPIKPAAPFNGELIVIGDDLVLRSTKKPLMHPPGPGTVASAWTAGYGLCHEGCLLRRLRFSKDLPRARRGIDRNTRAERAISSSPNRWASPGLISTQPAIGLIRLCLR